jgi:hypothetical protein
MPTTFQKDGFIIVRFESGAEICFPIAKNPRLARATHSQLNRIEISPFGLHWPELDEGNYGQKSQARMS